MQIVNRNGVEIDYCPQCRGVWLDRGELEKVVQQAANIDRVAPDKEFARGMDRPIEHGPAPYRRDDDDDDDEYRYRKEGHRGHKKKRMSDFLGDLFDF